MTSAEFLAAADRKLMEISDRAEATGAVQADRIGNVLTLELDNGAQVVVNLQGAMQEIWLACSRLGGFHYRLSGGVWRGTRDGESLDTGVGRALDAMAGSPVGY